MGDSVSGPKRQRPIKVLQVVGGLNRGGYETWLLNVLRNTARSEVQMDFLVDDDIEYAYSDEVRALGAKVLPCLGYRRPWRYWRNLKAIYAAHGPYDIVHSHFHYRSGFLMAMAKFLKVPSRIAHIYPAVDTEPPSPQRTGYRRLMLRAIRRYSTQVLSCSQTSLDAFVGECPDSTQPKSVIWIGIDLSPYSRRIDRNSVRQKFGLPVDKPLITYVARLVPHKNHAQMIRVADHLRSHPATPHFVMAGSHGNLLEEIRREASSRSNVSTVFGLDDISELLLASDLFFFPSLEEGFGIVAVEAAAAGLPVAATNLPTIREACPPSHRALMFEPNDDARAIASLRELLENPALRAQLGNDGKAWAERFTTAASRDSLIGTYRQRVGITVQQ